MKCLWKILMCHYLYTFLSSEECCLSQGNYCTIKNQALWWWRNLQAMFLRLCLIILTGTTEWMKMQCGHYLPGSNGRKQWRWYHSWAAAVEVLDLNKRKFADEQLITDNYGQLSLSGCMSIYHIWKTGIRTNFLGTPMQLDFYTWKMLNINSAGIANNNGMGHGVLRPLPDRLPAFK